MTRIAKFLYVHPAFYQRPAFDRDVQSYRQMQDKLWVWHRSARETNAGDRYLSRIVDVAIAFNGEAPQPLSENAKQAMTQVVQYRANLRSQSVGSRSVELEAG